MEHLEVGEEGGALGGGRGRWGTWRWERKVGHLEVERKVGHLEVGEEGGALGGGRGRWGT